MGKAPQYGLLGPQIDSPKAKFVTRLVQMGSEPLFDGVLSAPQLAAQVTAAKKILKTLSIPATVRDMVYGFTKDGGSDAVLGTIDHELPFFSSESSALIDFFF
jgi:hypothetical protein